jgi:hypothetical protein
MKPTRWSCSRFKDPFGLERREEFTMPRIDTATFRRFWLTVGPGLRSGPFSFELPFPFTLTAAAPVEAGVQWFRRVPV